MNMAQGAATALTAHPWVARVAVGRSGVRQQLHTDGVDALCRQGRLACIDSPGVRAKARLTVFSSPDAEELPHV